MPVHDRHLQIGDGEGRPGGSKHRSPSSPSGASRQLYPRTGRSGAGRRGVAVVVDDQDAAGRAVWLHVAPPRARHEARPRCPRTCRPGSCRPSWPSTAPRRRPGRCPPAGRHVFGEAGDAEAGRDLAPVRERVLGDDLADALRVEPGARLGRLHQQHGELVAALAGDHVDAARVLEEQVRHHAQGVVAHPVAELVVDCLEAVEVEQHHRHRMVEAAVAGQPLPRAGW